MDNKHAMPTDLAWLAGIIDGEGWIGLQKHIVPKNKCVAYSPHFRVTNSDLNIINRTQEILNSIGLNPYLKQQLHIEGRKTVYHLNLHKQANLKVIYEAVLPYLVGKKARAEMMLRYINKTIDREIAYQELKKANQRGKPSETTREAPLVVFEDEDIVQAA
jgi:hypothetical protein